MLRHSYQWHWDSSGCAQPSEVGRIESVEMGTVRATLRKNFQTAPN